LQVDCHVRLDLVCRGRVRSQSYPRVASQAFAAPGAWRAETLDPGLIVHT